jgi:hypothetical protein
MPENTTAPEIAFLAPFSSRSGDHRRADLSCEPVAPSHPLESWMTPLRPIVAMALLTLVAPLRAQTPAPAGPPAVTAIRAGLLVDPLTGTAAADQVVLV